MPAQDIYIPKETKVNSEIERLRVEATASLINRQDTIIIASVSCIYSLGNPSDYRNLAFPLKHWPKNKSERFDSINLFLFNMSGMIWIDDQGLFKLWVIQLKFILPYQKEKLRIELFGDTIESLYWVVKVNNTVVYESDNTIIFPAKHFVTTEDKKNCYCKY